MSLVAVVLTTVSIARTLGANDWDPTIYAAFGEDALETRAYAEDRLGEVYLRPHLGHDGKFFFAQAHDPWLTDPETHASVLDYPWYRSQRMLYPLLAGGGGLFASSTIVWTMILVNVVAMGAGTWATATVATRMGMSPWWGLAFVLNPGLISELNIDGSGVVAAAAAFTGVALLQRHRVVGSAALFALAALSRESMLVVALGAAVWVWRLEDRRRDALTLVAWPILSVGLWAVYAAGRLGVDTGAARVDVIGPPLLGFIQAFELWVSDPIGMVVGVFILLLTVVFALRTIISRMLVGYAFAGLGALALLATQRVWAEYFDITRAVAPIFTAYVLLLFAPTQGESDGETRDHIRTPAAK